MIKKIRIGTRGSDLALAQADQVIKALLERFPDVEMEKIILRTKGDKITDKPLPSFGGKGVFVTEFEKALLFGEIDLAVHSAKDMPIEIEDGLVIAGVLPRADARDVLVTNRDISAFMQRRDNLEERKKDMGEIGRNHGFVIGTGSMRRQFQVKLRYPQAECRGIRGNVPSRLRKLCSGEYDGVMLAAAGLQRLGLLEEKDLEYRFFSYDEMIPAGGQGIIAIEGRKDDEITGMVQEISDSAAYYALACERKILEGLNAGCHEAVGVFAQHSGDFVRIRLVWDTKGGAIKRDETAPTDMGLELAGKMTESVLREAALQRNES